MIAQMMRYGRHILIVKVSRGCIILECKTCGEFKAIDIECLSASSGVYDFRLYCKCEKSYVDLKGCQILGTEFIFPEEHKGIVEIEELIAHEDEVMRVKHRFENTTKGGKILPMEHKGDII